MAFDQENAPLLAYFQQQQTLSGWFDLLTIMVDGMVSNVGEQGSQPFLTQVGETLAQRFPLSHARTVGELEAQINAQLARFHWGVVEITAGDNALILHHRGLPLSRDTATRERWCNAFCAVLVGVYGRWLQEQGGQSGVSLWREQLFSLSDVQFRYQTT